MDPVFVGGKFVSIGNFSGTANLDSLTGGIASTPSEGDMVTVTVIVSSNADRDLYVDTTGYSEVLEGYKNVTSDANLSLHYKFMGATVDTSVHMGGGGNSSEAVAGIISVWRNVDPNNPFNVVATTSNGGNTAPPDPPSNTPDASGAVALVGAAQASATTAYTLSSSDLENVITGGVSDTLAIAGLVGSIPWSGSGAINPAALTSSGGASGDSWFSYTAILNPAPDVGTPVGRADETDTALGLQPVQIVATGLASETDTALALAGVAIAPTGAASETDSALGLSPVQIAATGLANEVDTAFSLGAGTPVGLAAETDTALALSSGTAVDVGLAIESDTALALESVSKLATGLASESDTALALVVASVRPVGLSPESDTAFALEPVLAGQTGLALEVDSALSLGGKQTLGLGMATETDVALALTAFIGTLPPPPANRSAQSGLSRISYSSGLRRAA